MHPAIWVGLGIAGLFTGKKFLEEANETGKLVLIGGGAFVSYKALKSAGVIK